MKSSAGKVSVNLPRVSIVAVLDSSQTAGPEGRRDIGNRGLYRVWQLFSAKGGNASYDLGCAHYHWHRLAGTFGWVQCCFLVAVAVGETNSIFRLSPVFYGLHSFRDSLHVTVCFEALFSSRVGGPFQILYRALSTTDPANPWRRCKVCSYRLPAIECLDRLWRGFFS